MKTTIIRAVAALSLAAAALLVPATANAYTDPAVVTATPAVVAPGGQTTFTTSSAPYQGDEEVLISVTGVNANGVTLASVVQTNNSLRTKAVNGKLMVPVKLPANATGTYNLTFTGTKSGIVLRSTITVAGSSSTPARAASPSRASTRAARQVCGSPVADSSSPAVPWPSASSFVAVAPQRTPDTRTMKGAVFGRPPSSSFRHEAVGPWPCVTSAVMRMGRWSLRPWGSVLMCAMSNPIEVAKS